MQLVSFDRIDAIVENRNRALTEVQTAVSQMTAAIGKVSSMSTLAREIAGGEMFYDDTRRRSDAYARLYTKPPGDESVEVFRREMDASIWQHLFTVTGIRDRMDHKTLEEWRKSLLDNVPEISRENILATFEAVAGEAETIFRRGIANAFSALDRRFKSHDGFKVGSRVILTYLFDGFGSIRWNSDTRNYLIDIERVFAILDGKQPAGNTIINRIEEDRRESKSWAPIQSETITEYFKIRCYKNGNCHLWFERPDLVKKVNLLLAEYYGQVLPDAAPAPKDTEWNKTTLPAKNLQFYRTPDETVQRILNDFYVREGDRVLEPSAGDGAFVLPLLKAGALVDAIEIDADRCSVLRGRTAGNSRFSLTQKNFLEVQPVEMYDLVLMNPPFFGTHYMDHVTHAYKFLKPGGTLITILPITAELGETKKHEDFRKWAKPMVVGWGRGMFRDLPAGSFKESGTNINTVTLTLRKPSK